MTQSEPDYRLYNLKQLYDIHRHIDKRRFPARCEALKREIARKEDLFPEEREKRDYPPCMLLQLFGAKPRKEEYQIGPALHAARLLVGLEFVFFGLIFGLPMLIMLPFFVIAIILYMFFFSGVTIMTRSLKNVSDGQAVELWSLVALGLSPFSAILYTLITVYITEQLFGYDGMPMFAVYLLPFAGFYTPFVLAVFWVKYHCREDGF